MSVSHPEREVDRSLCCLRLGLRLLYLGLQLDDLQDGKRQIVGRCNKETRAPLSSSSRPFLLLS